MTRFTFVAPLALLVLNSCAMTLPWRAPEIQPLPKASYAVTAQVMVNMPPEIDAYLVETAGNPDTDPDDRAMMLEEVGARSAGSAFAVRELDSGATWLVTNRHVVTGGESVTVSFDRRVTHVTAKVIYADEREDLAVIEIPVSRPIASLGPVPDEGAPVWALGYPSRSYQVSVGTVSNRCLQISDSPFGGSECYVQHTAAIDPGSSGGPLFDRRTGDVVGVNSMFAMGRNSVFIAIPASSVADVLKRAEASVRNRRDAAWMRRSLFEACQMVVQEALSVGSQVGRLDWLASPALIASGGYRSYLAWETPIKDEVVANLGISAAMRLASFARFTKDLRDAEGMFIPVFDPNLNDDPLRPGEIVRVRFKYGEGRRELFWRFEQGRWRLVAYYSDALAMADRLAEAEREDERKAEARDFAALRAKRAKERECEADPEADGCVPAEPSASDDEEPDESQGGESSADG